MHIAAPCSSFGYYRGSPDTAANPETLLNGGIQMATNVFTQGTGVPTAGGNSGWHPTVLYMFLLIIAEMFVFAWVSRHI